MIAREHIFYVNLRQAYLLSPLYAHRMSSRTVLFTSVPEDFLNEVKLRKTFGKQVKNIWIASDCEKLQDLVEERDKAAFKLEAAETKLIKLAGMGRLKSIKKGTVIDDRVRGDEDGESGSVASHWVDPKARPTHRLKFLIGKKVDTINWCRSELERLIPEIDALQATERAHEGKLICSVFVEFYTQTEAQAAYQSLAHHEALHMSPRFIGVDPEQVIWENLSINWASRVIRNIVTLTLVSLLIIFWSIPVGLVGIISNIDSLIAKAPWLGWLHKIPTAIFGVIQGLLPAVLLSVLMALLPIILRLMAKKAGAPSRAAIELRTQNFYFAFQVIQVFLVTTVTSAASAVGAQIANDPSSATSLLATNLPHAANFFLSYIIVQGLTLSSAALAQIVAVVIFRLLGKFLDNTPRKMYKRFSTLKSLGWGTVFPIYTNLTVIGTLPPHMDSVFTADRHSSFVFDHCAPGARICHHRSVLDVSRQSIQPAVRVQQQHRHQRIGLSPCVAANHSRSLHQHPLFDWSICYQSSHWSVDTHDRSVDRRHIVPCFVELRDGPLAPLPPQVSTGR